MLTRIAATLDRWAARLPALLRVVIFGPVLFGIAVGAGVWALCNPEHLSELEANRLSERDVESGLLYVLVASAALFLLGWVALRRKGDGSSALERAGRLRKVLTPLLALPLVAFLRVTGIEHDRPVLVLFLVALAAVACARGIHAFASERAWTPPAPRLRYAWAPQVVTLTFLAALWVGYAYLFARLSVSNHHALKTRLIDVGLYDNIFYQSSHGHPLGTSLLKGETHTSSHFDPILVLLAPAYRLYPRAELLLVLQSVWLGAGVVPVFLIARGKLASRTAGLAFAAIYALYPALHGANLCEFHSLSLLSPVLLWVLYFLEAGFRRAYWAALVVALLCREDVAILACFVGLYALSDKRPGWVRTGWLTVAASAVWFVVVKRCFMRSNDFFNGGAESYGYAFYYEDLIPHNRGLEDVVLSLATNPVFVIQNVFTEHKLLFVLLLLMPLGFLPLFAKRGRVMLVYGAIFCLLASDQALSSVHFYYASVILPVAFALAPEGLRHVVEGRFVTSFELDARAVKSATLALCLVSAALVSWKFGAIVENDSFRGPTGPIVRTLSESERDTYAWVQATVARVPKDAALGVTMRTGAHASNRMKVTLYPYGPLGDYLFINEIDLRPYDLARHHEAIENGDFVELARRDSMVLLRVERR